MTASPAHDLAELKALNARFIHNFVTNDVRAHDEILHRDFMCITARGKYESRDDYLKRWATGFDPMQLVYFDYRDERITLCGDIALVRSSNKFVSRSNGIDVTAMTTYTDTYVREGAGWKCIQAQITALAPEFYPGHGTIVRKYVNGVLAE